MNRTSSTSLAHERKDHKSQCSLCNLYYDRQSINYKVPIYRIIELRNSWNYQQGGKRFESASYRYFTVRVCLFCSQFFSETTQGSETADDTEQLIVHTKKVDPALCMASLNRHNLAVRCTAYQSSTVDAADASIPLKESQSIVSTTEILHELISIPFAKTRREENAFWEVDLGGSWNIRTIKISLSAGNAKSAVASIYILPRPLGCTKYSQSDLRSISTASETFHLLDYEPSNKKVGGNKLLLHMFQDLFWTLPPTGTGGAIRVVLHGKHSLQIFSFEAYQGDEFIDKSKAEDSRRLEHSLHEWKEPVETSPVLTLSSPHALSMSGFPWSLESSTPKVKDFVRQLQGKMDDRYEERESWERRTEHAASYLNPNDVIALMHCVFNHILKEANITTEMLITEENCFDEAILHQSEPRIPLPLLLKRLKVIFRWIQMRDVSKQSILKSLFSSTAFQDVQFHPKDVMSALAQQFQVVQRHEELVSRGGGESSTKDIRVGLTSSCCWAQFLLIIELACTKRMEYIPSEVFFIQKSHATSARQLSVEEGSMSSEVSLRIPSTREGGTDFGRATFPPILPSSNKLQDRRQKTKVFSASMNAQELKVLTQPPSVAYHEVIAPREVKPRGLQRHCGLCCFKFPSNACTNIVTVKHLVALRKHWDPYLVSSEVLALEQSASFLTNVFVCGFCNQFFDANIREKIIEESLTKERPPPAKDPVVEKIDEPSLPMELFYDARYI